jgi:eukaryotic-like serine/threonine-protein kinase
MATVFLARDVRYDRKVAVKVLSPELGAVLGAERFLSEIRVTATLQHPNLLPLFDSGESGGLLYYVMPFVDGETLRARLDREKQLSVADTVRLGSAIASALDYAHRNGVIHRDLKPENILLQDGQPLVADFGIALAVSNAGGARVTQTGLSLGTPQYMSPEQATGDRTIDARSDVYALGAILYECLTGEPPHTGTTAQAIIARLMTEEPRAISATRKSVPAHVEAAIAMALQKLPADRWGSARDLGEALQEASRTVPQHVVASRSGPSRWSARAISVCAGAGVVAVGAGYAGGMRNVERAGLEPTHFTVGLPIDVRVASPAGLNVGISRDGRRLLVVGERVVGGGEYMVYARHLDSLDAYPVAGSERGAGPVFTPDGENVVVMRPQGDQRVVSRMPLQGGAATTLVELNGALLGASWANGEYYVFAPGSTVQRLGDRTKKARVIADIGQVPKAAYFSNPYPFPDGKTVGARVHVGDVDKLALFSIDSGAVRLTDIEMSNVVGYIDGTLFFGKLDGWIYQVRFDPASGDVQGVPERVMGGISAKSAGGLNAVLSSTGTLAILRGAVGGNIEFRAFDGTLRTVQTERKQYRALRWSPDGSRIAAELIAATAQSFVDELWLIDPRSGAPTRVTYGDNAAWSADGRMIAYSAGTNTDTGGLYLALVDGSAPARRVFSGRARASALLQNGASLLVEQRGRLFTVPTSDSTKRMAVIRDDENGRAARVSPDENWLAYLSDRNGRTDLFVKPLTSGGAVTQVSVQGATHASWGGNGRHLYYRSGGALWRATLTLDRGTANVVQRDSLFPVGEIWDVHPTKPEIAMLQDRTGESQLQVFTGWAQRALTKKR